MDTDGYRPLDTASFSVALWCALLLLTHCCRLVTARGHQAGHQHCYRWPVRCRQAVFVHLLEQFVDEFSFPANPSASHVTIAAGIPGCDAASKSEEQGGHSRRKPGLVGAVDALLVRVLNRLEQRAMDRRQD